MKNQLVLPKRLRRLLLTQSQTANRRWIARLPLLAVLAAAPAHAAITFSPRTDYDTGSGPRNLRSADLNRDGNLDMVTANFTGYSVSVLLGNANGTFRPRTDYAVPPPQSNYVSSNALVIDDFNNDGKLDVAVTGRDDARVQVLLGDGSGGLGTAIPSASSGNSFSLASGDFNGDGKRDLASVDYMSSNVTVLLGNGNGTFASPVNYTAGQRTYGVAVADLNGDGKDDLAVANNDATADSVSVLLGNGNGTFNAKTDYAAGRGPRDVSIIDLDGDGDLDMIVGNFGASSPAPGNASLSVLLNNGNGTFAAATDYPTADGTFAGTFAGIGADLDGDGKPDLVSANNNGNTLGVRPGNGDGTFGAQTAYAAGAGSRSVVSGDFNHDGKLDLAVAQGNTSNGVGGLGVFLNTTTAVAVNNAPTLDAVGNVSYKRNHGAKTVNLSGIDDGDAGATQTLSVSATSSNEGVATVGVNYTPNNSTGSLSITPTGVGTTTITVTVTDNGSPNQSVQRSFDVTVSNAAPVANAQSVSVAKNTATAITLSGSDSDGDSLTYTVLTNPANGTLSGTAPNLTYTPNAGYSGADSFTYRVSDGSSNSTTATVSLNVSNVAPVLSGIESTSQTYTQGGAATPITNSLVVSDGDNATLVGATVIISGGLVASEDRLLFTAQNGISGVYNVSTGVLTLSGSATLAQYQAALRSVTYQNISSADPNTANRTISFQVNDGASSNNLSNIATRTVSVALLNKAPVNNVPGDQITNEDTPLVFSAANGNALSISDADAGNGSLTVLLSVTNGIFAQGNTSTLLLHGTLAQINAQIATLTYVPNANFNGTSSFTFATDDNGNTGAGGSRTDGDVFFITVRPVNDAPSFVGGGNVTVNEDAGATSQAWASAISAGPANESGQTLNFAVTGNTNPGLFSVAPAIAADGTLTFMPAPNASGSATVTVQLSDNGGTDNGGSDTSGTVTFTITVNAVNDAPVAASDVYSTAFGKALTVNAASGILANDSDVEGDLLSAGLETGPAHGTLVLNADGSFTYTPDAGYFGSDSFTYRASDGQSANSLSNVATVTINVAANIAPVAVDDSRSTSEDTFVDINVVGNDTDADGGTLRVAEGSIANVKGGTAELQSDGKTIRFTPSANANDGNTSGGFGFTYRVSDGTDASLNTGTVTITVSAVNDAPVVNGVTLSTLSPKTRDILTASYGASDVDGDELTPTYVWYNGSTEVQRGASNTLNLATAGFGDKGDEITVAVSVSDGTTSSELKSSEAATVINTAPFIGSVTLAPVAPLTSDDIVASVNGAGDDDNDGLTYSYVWKKGSTVIEGQSGATLPASATENGDTITVVVTANDGSDDSLPVQSSVVTVQNLAPTVESLSPQGESDKVGAKRTFTMTVSDGNGAGDIKEAWLLINTRLNWAEGATLIYVPSASSPKNGLLYLRRGDAFLAPIQIGEGASSSAVLDNGAVRVVGSEVVVTVSEDGKSFTLSIPATIRDGLVGTNTMFTRVADRSGATDPMALPSDNGYRRFGSYTVTSQFVAPANSAPVLSGLSPRAANTRIPVGGGQLQTFVFYAKDENGIGDIESLWFVAGKTTNWGKSATFVYQPRTRRLFLRSDDGQSFIGGGQIGSTGIIENSKVRVDLSKVQVLIYADGKSMGLRLPLEPKGGLVGQNTIWLRAQDLSGATAAGGDAQGFVQSGTWNVVQGASANGVTAPSGGGA